MHTGGSMLNMMVNPVLPPAEVIKTDGFSGCTPPSPSVSPNGGLLLVRHILSIKKVRTLWFYVNYWT